MSKSDSSPANESAALSPRWRDRVDIARAELAATIVILSDILDGRAIGEEHLERALLARRRLRALLEIE